MDGNTAQSLKASCCGGGYVFAAVEVGAKLIFTTLQAALCMMLSQWPKWM